MASLGMQMLASSLALLGWVGTLLSCILPMWRVTAFMGTTIVTSETMWEGIWMSCVTQSTGQIQCKPYESTLALSTDLQAARALMVMAILVGAAGLVLAFFGGKCTIFLSRSKSTKTKVATIAGIALIVAGVLCLIPVSWSAGIVVKAFYNPQLTDSQRREIGGAIYTGWGASIILVLSGGMLCSTICTEDVVDDSGPSVKYLVVRSSRAGSSVTGSQKKRPVSVRSLQNSAPSVTSQWSQKAPLDHKGRLPSTCSEQSKPSISKAQLARADSIAESEQSEGASTNSNLIEKSLDQTLATSEHSETSADPPKTYI